MTKYTTLEQTIKRVLRQNREVVEQKNLAQTEKNDAAREDIASVARPSKNAKNSKTLEVRNRDTQIQRRTNDSTNLDVTDPS